MEKRKYTLGSKLGYAVGDVLGGGAFALTSLLFLNFLVTIEGIPAALGGVIVLAGKFWDAVIDPTLGILSDRMKSRFGRRRVFLLIGIIPVIVTFALLWYSFGIQGTTLKFIYYLFMYILFTTSFSIIQVPYNALLSDMVDDYEARAGYSSLRILISNIAATISVTVPNMILGPVESRTPYSFLIMSTIFGLFFGLPILITFFTTKERPVHTDGDEVVTIKMMLKQLGKALRNKTFLQFIGIFIFAQAATDVNTSVTAFWLTDILHHAELISIVAGISMIVGLIVLPINNLIAKKLGKHCPAYIILPFRILGCVIAFFLGAKTGMPIILLVCILGGLGGSASSFVPYTLLPDLPDTDEMITGNHNAGIYAGMATFLRTLSSGIAVFLTGVVLDLFGYMESTAGAAVEQTPTALFGIRFLFSIVPLLLTLAAVVIGIKYRMTKANHKAMREAVEYKHQNGVPTEDPALIAACETISGMPFSEMWVGQKQAVSVSSDTP